MKKEYTITVFNTCTSEYEDVQVTKAVYDEYRRGEWRISKNDAKHRANETLFSALLGNDDGACENFREFIEAGNDPELLIEKQELFKTLHSILDGLKPEDRRLIHALFFEGMNEYAYADLLGVSHQRINKRKQIIFKKIRKKLREMGC